MTQQAPQAQQPTCVLCAMWQRLPHAARWSTPVPHDEAEACLTIGYWLRRSLEGSVARFCERHAKTLEALDKVGLTDASQLLAPIQGTAPAAPAQAQVTLMQSSVLPMPQQPTPGVHSTGAEQTQPVPGVLPTAAQLAPAAPRVVQPIPGVVPGGPLPQLLYDPATIQAPAAVVGAPVQGPPLSVTGQPTAFAPPKAEVEIVTLQASSDTPTLPAIEGHPEAALGQVPATCPLCKKSLEKGMHVCQAG